eukprot:2625988-Rhodomonas_salina.1
MSSTRLGLPSTCIRIEVCACRVDARERVRVEPAGAQGANAAVEAKAPMITVLRSIRRKNDAESADGALLSRHSPAGEMGLA